MSVEPDIEEKVLDTRPLEEIIEELQRDIGVTRQQARRMARRARGEFPGGILEVDGPDDPRLKELGIKLD